MARRKPAQVHGLLIADKPSGCTSHDVVDRVRRIMGERRVGHSGTLDPDATGVLLCGVGEATRLLRFLDVVQRDGRPTTSKTYRGSVVLGIETDSLDASGSVTAVHDMSDLVARLTVESTQDVVDRHFRGEITQVPPMVSAIRVDGQRLHELARQGVEVERQARQVTIHDIRVVAVDDGVIDLEVTCSSGTFIRTLAADLGTALGGGAHLRNLRRTAVGPFTVDEALSLELLESLDVETARRRLLPVVECVRGLSARRATAELRSAVSVGSVLPASTFEGCPPWAVVSEKADEVLAIYEPFSNERVGPNMARPVVVLAAPER